MVKIMFKSCFDNKILGINTFSNIYGFGIWFKQGAGFNKYSDMVHVEMYFPSNGWSYSSSENDNGERLKRINYTHQEYWKCIDIDIKKWSKGKFQNDEEFFHNLINKRAYKTDLIVTNNSRFEDINCNFIQLKARYDWKAIALDKGLPLNLEDHKKRYCSEAVAMELNIKNNDKTPSELYEYITNKLYILSKIKE